MKSNANELLERAVAAKIAAIEIYNKVDFPYRAESFCILSVNGWELLLKAKWVAEHNDDIESLYEKQPKQNKVLETNSGIPKTHGINYIAKNLFDSKKLDKNVYTNLGLLIEFRNSAIHFFNPSFKFRSKIQELGMASIRNFVMAASEWFDYDFSKFNFYLMPLSFIELHNHTNAINLNNKENNFLEYMSQLIKETKSANDSEYAVNIDVNMRFTHSNKSNAHMVRTTTDPNAPTFHITEEQILTKFPWDYKKLTDSCKNRYKDFLCNSHYHKIRKDICKNKTGLCKTRYLDPRSNKGGYKEFYSTKILTEFDKYYENQ